MLRAAAFTASTCVATTLALAFAGCLDLSGDGEATDGADASSATDVSPTPEGASAETGGDGAIVVPANGFAATLAPPHVTLDPGESTDVTITLVRGADFKDAVDVTVQGLGADLVANPPTVTIPSGSNTAKFTLVANANAKVPQDPTLDVLVLSKRDTSLSTKTNLGVRIGSLFEIVTATKTLPIPPWATQLDLKVWGAGGGAGGAINASGTSWGGTGGGGGFAAARVPVDPTAALTIVVGSGGASGMDHAGDPVTPLGGGGGGYSAISQGATMLVVAGGGGGGGGGQAVNNSGTCQGEFSVYMQGLGGGGGDGQTPSSGLLNRSATTTKVGAADVDGGAAPGAALLGGDALMPTVSGGVPGGGKGGFGDDGCWGYGGGGGGGGGGWFGGGSGLGRQGIYGSHVAGGGGGSGTVIAGATQIVQTASNGAAAAGATDPDYVPPAGAGGARGTADAGAGTGQSGRIVVRFAKP